MVDTLGAEKMNDRLARTFAASLSAWERAAAATGVVERSYIIGGYAIRLRFAGPALLDGTTRAMAHLEAGAETKPMLTIYLADSSSTGVDFAACLGLTSGDRNGAGWIYRGERIRARFQPASNNLNILDPSRNLALFWTEDGSRMPFWERSAPLLYIFHWWMELRGRQLVHAAAVGTADGGALLVGKAGSGKSTTALSCLSSALGYAGDDYHLIALDPFPFAFSLYNSAKLDVDRLQQFGQLRHAFANPHETAQDKAVLFIHECRPEKVSSGFLIRAVLVPRIAHRGNTRVQPISAATALAALAPSTILQLRDRDGRSLNTMAELLRRVPSFSLDLGPDLSQIAPAILELLARAELRPKPLASVIVPVYNGERFLAAALDSIFAQDYHPIEVIVVDDGSNDRTGEIARSFVGVRLLVQENQGQAAARNRGIHEARGEFIAFLDADDLMLPDKLSAQIDSLLRQPETGCSLAGQEILFEPGVEPPSWLGKSLPLEEAAGMDSASPSGMNELKHVRDGGMSAVVVRRQTLERIGGFNPCYRHVDDIDWLFRVWESGAGVAVLPQVLWRRRIHGDNLTHRRRAVQQEWLDLIKVRIDRRRAPAASS